MEIRRCGSHEAPEVAELWLRARRAAVPVIPAPVHTDDEVRAWFADAVVPVCEVWAAHDGGAVVGLLVLEGEELDQLYVDPVRQGEGIGGRLLATAKERRPGGLSLWTFAANETARRFYERHGFAVIGATDGDNEEGAPDVRYAWRPAG